MTVDIIKENPLRLKEIVSDSCGSVRNENPSSPLKGMVINSLVVNGSCSFTPPACIILPTTSALLKATV